MRETTTAVRRSTLLAGGLLVLAGAFVGARADLVPLTLYQKTGRAPLVVWGEVEDGEHRFARIRTLGVVRCSIPECPGDAFRIVFRLESFLRRPWEDKIEFQTGERLLLFLRKFTKEDGERPEGDLYTLMWGAQGRHPLPPEGEEAHVGAARAFAAIHDERDLLAQEEMLVASLSDRNPLIVEGAFEEMTRQRLGGLDLVPRLTGFFESPREAFRVSAARLLSQVLSDARVAGRPVPAREELADLIRGRIALDEAAAFRVEAIAALTEIGGEEVRVFLARLAEEDPSQEVRYEAHRALLAWERRP